MSRKITRRDFLKMGALTGAGAMLAACTPKATAVPTAVPPTSVAATAVPTGPGPVATANATARDALIRAEGKIVSYGLPDYWADWKTSWANFTGQYGLAHEDIDLSSAEELQRFEAEKASPYGDVGDVGITWGPIGKEKGVIAAYKHPWWDEIPDYFKDPDGYWCVWYYGAMTFGVLTSLVPNIPTSFADLLKPEYKNMVGMSDPRQAAQGIYTVLAATAAKGGDEKDLMPGVEFFKQLKQSGNLSPGSNNIAGLQSGEIAIKIGWDYLNLGDRDTLAAEGTELKVVVPSDGSCAGPYAGIINATAPHPNAARGWFDYIFSDRGQIDRARGYARPVRKVAIPADIAAKLIPEEQFKSVYYIKDYTVFGAASAIVKDKWGPEVMGE